MEEATSNESEEEDVSGEKSSPPRSLRETLENMSDSERLESLESVLGSVKGTELPSQENPYLMMEKQDEAQREALIEGLQEKAAEDEKEKEENKARQIRMEKIASEQLAVDSKRLREERISKYMKIPGIIVILVSAVIGIASFFGFEITPETLGIAGATAIGLWLVFLGFRAAS